MNEEATEKWRQIHNEEPYKLYSSPNIVSMIKDNEMINTGVDGNIILKCILQ